MSGSTCATTKLAIFGSPSALTPVMEATLLAALDLPLGGRRTPGRRVFPPTVGSPGLRRSAT